MDTSRTVSISYTAYPSHSIVTVRGPEYTLTKTTYHAGPVIYSGWYNDKAGSITTVTEDAWNAHYDHVLSVIPR